MVREDYEHSVGTAVNEFPEDMMLQARETDPHCHYLPLSCEVRNKKSFILSPRYEDEECEKELSIDIFPTDRYHKQKLPSIFEKMAKVYNMSTCKGLDAIYFKDESIDKKMLAFFHPVFHKLVLQHMKLAEKLIDKNRGLGTDYRLGYGFDTLRKRYFRFDDIFPVVETDFEDSKLSTLHRPDVYLATLYGPNYIALPPEKQRSAAQRAYGIKSVI